MLAYCSRSLSFKLKCYTQVLRVCYYMMKLQHLRLFRKILNELSGQPENRNVKEEAGDSKSSDSSESDSGGQVTSVPPPTLAYQNVTGSGINDFGEN